MLGNKNKIKKTAAAHYVMFRDMLPCSQKHHHALPLSWVCPHIPGCVPHMSRPKNTGVMLGNKKLIKKPAAAHYDMFQDMEHVPEASPCIATFPGVSPHSGWLWLFLFFSHCLLQPTPWKIFFGFFKHIKPWRCIHTLKKLINIVKNEKSTLENNKNKNWQCIPQKEHWPRQCRGHQNQPRRHGDTVANLKRKHPQHMTCGFPKKIFFPQKKVPTRRSDLQKKSSSTPTINLHLGASATAEGCFSGATTATARSAG